MLWPDTRHAVRHFPSQDLIVGVPHIADQRQVGMHLRSRSSRSPNKWMGRPVMTAISLAVTYCVPVSLPASWLLEPASEGGVRMMGVCSSRPRIVIQCCALWRSNSKMASRDSGRSETPCARRADLVQATPSQSLDADLPARRQLLFGHHGVAHLFLHRKCSHDNVVRH